MKPTSSAILAGATGAVGRHVLAGVLAQPAFTKITTIGRRPVADLGGDEGRVTQHVVDMLDAESYERHIEGHDAAFCTLGIGEASKARREELYRVDVVSVIAFAEACRRHGVRHFSVMTSVGANTHSRFDYLRMKGEVEDRVRALGFERASVFRPSLLVTPKNRYGITQAITLAVFPKVDWLFAAGLRKFRSIRVDELGRAMAANAVKPSPGKKAFEVYDWESFKGLTS